MEELIDNLEDNIEKTFPYREYTGNRETPYREYTGNRETDRRIDELRKRMDRVITEQEQIQKEIDSLFVESYSGKLNVGDYFEYTVSNDRVMMGHVTGIIRTYRGIQIKTDISVEVFEHVFSVYDIDDSIYLSKDDISKVKKISKTDFLDTCDASYKHFTDRVEKIIDNDQLRLEFDPCTENG